MANILSKMKLFFTTTIFILLLIFLNYSRTNIIVPSINISKQESAINFRKDFFLTINIGLKRLIADILWIRTLLDSDLTHYYKDDLGSWMFLRFDLMTDLDPYFLEAYRFGGQYFSVVKNDQKGASYIFEKGLKNFPKDFSLNFYGGIHDYIELNNPVMAYKKLSIIQNSPHAPRNIKSIMARIIAGEGQLTTAFDLIFEIYKNEDERFPLKKIHENALYSLKAEIDLNCLNSKASKKNCSEKDFFGNKYLYINGEYKASREWSKFRVQLRK